MFGSNETFKIADDAEVSQSREVIKDWLETLTDRFAGMVTGIDGDSKRWLVRTKGQVKEYTTVWFSLDQRSLQVESQLMPAAEEDVERCYEFLLRKNSKLV
ncbi:MAG: hypothetical protein HKL80_06185, partial [Acidimicrobiales bacterium]|nr:hypothetical protein [Acidimicrobiales bacterium]